PPISPLFPYPTLFRSRPAHFDPFRLALLQHAVQNIVVDAEGDVQIEVVLPLELEGLVRHLEEGKAGVDLHIALGVDNDVLDRMLDRKSTRLNSSHVAI